MTDQSQQTETAEATEGFSVPAKRHRGLKVFLVILFVLVFAAAAACAVLYYDDQQRIQKVPQTTMLDGTINVSGMTADQLRQTVQTRVDNGFSSKVSLTVGGKSYSIELGKVGSLDVDSTVSAAFAPYDKPVYERCIDRVQELIGHKKESYAVSTKVDSSSKKIKKELKRIAASFDTDPVNASYSVKGTKLVGKKGSDGRKLDVKATAKAIQELLLNSKPGETKTLEATVKTVAADNAELGKAIIVDTSACTLKLYDDGKVVFKCLCSPGRSGYETPKGDFHISYKDPHPTWVNPHSDWSKNMPETIGPGASNPMGLRKMAVSCGNSIFIHGTNNIGALGSRDSHGCIRVANSNIVKLYPKVPVKTPVFIR